MNILFGLYLQRGELSNLEDVATLVEGAIPDDLIRNRIRFSGRALMLPPEPTGQENPEQENSDGLLISGEITLYNRQDIAEKTGLDSASAAELDDAQMVLRAYRKWGRDCVLHLRGDFAFAVYDPGEKRLFLARDHMGVVQCNYASQGGRFAFSSKLKPLIDLPWLETSVNLERVAQYLEETMPDTVSTYHTGISQLPFGHFLEVTPDGENLKQYWKLDPSAESRFAKNEDYEDRFRELFTRSVRARLSPNAGSNLSGGFDSSSISCVAMTESKATRKGDFPVFPVIYPGIPSGDERPYIDSVVSHGKFTPHYVQGDCLNPFDELDDMITAAEGPLPTANFFVYWKLYKIAREAGVDVLLDGLIGDSVVGHGDRRLTEIAARGQILRFAQEVWSVASFSGGGRRRKVGQATRLVNMYGVQPIILDPLDRWKEKLSGRGPAQEPELLTPELAQSVDWHNQSLLKPKFHELRNSTRLEQLYDVESGGIIYAVSTTTKIAKTHGISHRYPFTNPDLIEYCLSVPSDQKMRDGQTRVYARRGMRPYLPAKISGRQTKGSWLHAFDYNLMKNGRAQLEEEVRTGLNNLDGIVRREKLTELFGQLFNQSVKLLPAAQADLTQKLWSAIVVSRWLDVLGKP